MKKKISDNLPHNISTTSSYPTHYDFLMLVGDVLTKQLADESYGIFGIRRRVQPDMGIDVLAVGNGVDGRKPSRIGVQISRRASPLGPKDVRKALPVISQNSLDQLVMIAERGFTNDAKREAASNYPVDIQLLDVEGLRQFYVAPRSEENPSLPKNVIEAIRRFNRSLVQMIAQNPDELDCLDWRRVEELLATAFEEMGFHVELTPCSKDGGRDIILNCIVDGRRFSYIIEVKHWRKKSQPGKREVAKFAKVTIRENCDSGLILSTNGFAASAFETRTKLERSMIRVGDKDKIVSLCRTVERKDSGLLLPTHPALTDVYLEDTLSCDEYIAMQTHNPSRAAFSNVRREEFAQA